MKISWVVLTLALFSCKVSAEAPQVVSLYDQKSRMPGALIPFKVLNGSILDTTITSSSAGCRIMKDPFLSNIFLLKCTQEGSAQVTLKISSGNQIYNLNYGPVEIKNPFSNVVVVEPDVPTTDQDAVIGRTYFNTYCITCHNPPQTKANKSISEIKSAIQSQSQMRQPQYGLSALTEDQIKKIQTYLKGL